MIGYSSVTQKGQITIPAAIRQQLGLDTGSPVVITRRDNAAIIHAADDVFALRGSVTGKKLDKKKMRRKFIHYLSTHKQT